ncbi:MAG: DUF2099 family protein [Methanomicrobium sp.]|nr:DUF2099 family protein [Methanomicrobium sp.]
MGENICKKIDGQIGENIDEHIIEAVGRARITIRNGRVVAVEDPVIKGCPLARRFKYPVSDMTADEIKKNIEGRIADFGMCTPERRVLSNDDFVLFGASELLNSALSAGIIDCAVLACDGAGTVIVSNPALIQGIGGKMSGLVKTTAYPEVIARINDNGGHVVFSDGRLDAFAGCRKAYELGYKKVAVTVALVDDAEKIRAAYPDAIIICVHTTGHSRENAEKLAETCDLIFACSSAKIREVAGSRALVQGGTGVPVFAMTQKGKEIILEKIRTTKMQVMIRGDRLPMNLGNEPEPLI